MAFVADPDGNLLELPSSDAIDARIHKDPVVRLAELYGLAAGRAAPAPDPLPGSGRPGPLNQH